MAKPQKESIWLLKKPIGDSEVIRRGNLMRRTTSAFTCEFCGTYHKELNQADVGRTIFRLLGREGVMECCGKLVDIVYKEWKNNFVIPSHNYPLHQHYTLHIKHYANYPYLKNRGSN